MASDSGDDWAWDETLFAGAADYYEQGRLPYAPGLADAMAEALGLNGEGWLLDVGCGPGTVTLRLAHLFETVVGLDPDPGMLRVAERLAAERQIVNARWVQRRAEELPAGLAGFRVVTLAASFHWMKRPKVARAVLAMLDPGGVVVHVDSHHQDGPLDGDGMPYPAPPIQAMEDLRRKYLGSDRRAGRSIRNSSPDDEDAVFRASGYTGPDRVRVPDSRVLERSSDDLVAQVFSMSSTTPHLLGDRVGDFEADLRLVLADASSSGLFSVRLPDNELKIWRPS